MDLLRQLDEVLRLPNVRTNKIKVRAGEQVQATCDSVLIPEDGIKLINVFTQLLLVMVTESISIAEDALGELDVPKEVQQELRAELDKVAELKNAFSVMQVDLQKAIA